MRVAVFGAGLVGQRAAVSLAADDRLEVLLLAQRRTPEPVTNVTVGVGWPHPAASDVDVVVLATESPHHFAHARQLVRSGVHVVSTADEPTQVERMWSLGDLARDNGAAICVGAAYSPGISTLLAAHLVRGFDDVSTIATAQFGTGGPSCAREHHRAMSASAREVHRGLLRATRGGTGRELVWFPEPAGAADCYRAGLADPFLLHQAFPAISRIESRQAATRRDRLTARLPMLRAPHAEGLVGAVWAEVRGRVGGRVEHRAMAATAPPATGAAALVAAWVANLADDLAGEGMRLGSQSAAHHENTVLLLKHISKDVRLWTYDGSRIVTKSGPTHAARKWRIGGENPAIATIFNPAGPARGSFA